MQRWTGLGGLDALGGPKTDNMYHAGWAWAGNTPFHRTKLVAAHFGGTRNPLADLLAGAHQAGQDAARAVPPCQRYCADALRLLGIKPPNVVDGFTQDPIDGVSMAYTFADAGAPDRKRTQYFENNGSRGIYHDGWYACTFGPLVPWDTAGSVGKIKNWDAEQGRLGALRSAQGLLAGRRSRRQESEEGLPS